MANKTKTDGISLSEAEGSWLSINRAAKILEPGFGSFEIAKERIWDALRETQLTISSARPSPIHPIPEYSETYAKADWFTTGRERGFVRGMQSSTECVQEWGSFLNDGGLLVERRDVEALDEPRSWQKVTPELVSKCSQHCTNWILPEALAWIATRDFKQVAQIGCDAPWAVIEGEESFNGQRVFKEAKQRASIGWLIRSVALHHCDCGAQNDAQREAWENCSCTTRAFNRLWDAVSEGKLAAYDEVTRSAIVASEIPGFALDCERFTLTAPRHPGAVCFRRVALERIWPASRPLVRNRGGRQAQYDWPAFTAEAKRRLWEEGGFHEGWIQSDCEREMHAWCDANWTRSPSESILRERLKAAQIEFEREKAGNHLSA